MASWQTYYGRGKGKGKGKCYLGLDVWAQESEVEQQPPLPVGESVFRSALSCKHVLDPCIHASLVGVPILDH